MKKNNPASSVTAQISARLPAKTAGKLSFRNWHLALVTLAALFLGREANGQQNTQDIFTSGTDLTVGSNWSLNAVPTVGNDAVFSPSSTSGTLSLGAATATYGSLDVTNTDTTAAITNVSTTGTTTLTLGGAGDMGNSVTGAASTDLIYVTTGTTVLTLAGTTKALNIVLGQSGAFDVGSTSTLNIGASGAASSLNLGGDTLTMSGSGGISIGSVISNGSIAINAGATYLSGANTFSGGITLTGGTLYMNNASALGSGTLTIGAGTTINDSSGTITDSQNNAMTWNGSFTYGGSKTFNFGSGAVNITTPLTLTQNGNTLTIGGTIASTDGQGIFDVTKAGGGTLTIGENITYTSAETFNVDAGTEILTGTVAGSAPLTVTGGGELAFTGTNNTTGSSAMTVTGGSQLNFTDAAGMTSAARASSVTLSRGTLSTTGYATANSLDSITGSLTIGGNSGSGATLDTVALAANAAKNTELTAGSLVRANHGVVLFTGANLGVDAPGTTANSTNIVFTSTPTLVGGGGSGASSTTISILPWAVGDVPGGDGSTFVTYTANGIAPLTASQYAGSITDGNTSSNNVDITVGGTTTINAGATINALIINGLTATISGTGTLTVTSGAVLLNPGNSGSVVANIAAPLNFGTAEGVIGASFDHAGTISGSISGSGGLTVYQVGGAPSGSGLTISGANTYSGNTYLFANVNTYGSPSTVFPDGNRTGDVYLYSTWTFEGQTINGLFGNGYIAWGHSFATTLTVGDNNATSVFSGEMQGTENPLDVTKIGSGTLTLTGLNINVNAATASVNGGALLLDFSNSALTANILGSSGATYLLSLGGGTLNLNGAASAVNSQSFSSVTFNAGGSGAVLNANATSNPLLLAMGSLSRNTGATVDFTLPAGGQSATNGITTTSTNFLANSILVSATSGGIAYATVGGGSDWASLSGSNVVAYSTVGTYSTGNASYTGTNNVSVANGDTMTTGTVNSLYFNAATDGLTLSGTDTIGTGGILVTAAATAANISSGTLISGAGRELVLIDNGALTVNSVIANSGGVASALTISGSGTTILSGSNTFTGQTYMDGSSVTVINSDASLGAIATGAQINMNGGTLKTSGSFSLDNSGSARRAIVLGNNGGTFDVAAGGDLTVSGVISGGIVGVTTGLTKVDSGVLTLAGTNTYLGNTIVKGGTLIVSGSLSGSTAMSTALGSTLEVNGGVTASSTITDGGTLQGAGVIGAVSVSGSGTLAPGDQTYSTAVGTLTAKGNVTLTNSTSILSIRLGQTTSGDFDRLVLSTANTVTLGGASLQLVLGPNYADQPYGTFYEIINGDVSTLTAGAAIIGTFAQGSTLTDSRGDLFDILYDVNSTDTGVGNDVLLEAVPEPGTWGMLACGMGALILFQRGRRRKN